MAKALAILLCLVPALAAAQAYRWTDERGRVHYGDKGSAVQSAKAVENRISSISGPAVVSSAPSWTASAEAKVVLYSTQECVYCKRAKEHFASRRIRYVERDVGTSPDARREFDKLGGRGVPVILVGAQRMDGYSRSSLEQLLKSQGL